MRQQLRGLFLQSAVVRLPVCFIKIVFFGGSTLLNINNGTDKPCCFGTSFTVCVNCGSQGANREREQRESSTWWDWYMMVSCST